jgi:hypothetical protein
MKTPFIAVLGACLLVTGCGSVGLGIGAPLGPFSVGVGVGVGTGTVLYDPYRTPGAQVLPQPGAAPPRCAGDQVAP